MKYTVEIIKRDVYVIEATSDKYEINAEKGYIYTGADIDSEIILDNIELNYGEASIENNQLGNASSNSWV